ncbi:glycosyltransferase [Aliikangiella maris]|uniref:Glycosyltransferase family 4 protein n=2 Tax=Aliikangiella maris TaxID=3162458 RepID=A0ABV3MS73_9GAMM
MIQPPKQTVLVIGYVWPEPASSAAGAHMLSLLKLFRQQNWRVIFATPAQTTEFQVDLSSLQIETASIALNDSSFDEFVKALNPHIVLFDRFMMEEQFAWRVEQNCPEALRILDTEDLQCLRNARQTALKRQQTLTVEQTLTAKDLCSDLAKREIAAILRSDLSLIISDYEIDLLTNYYRVDNALLHHLPFMLDLSTLQSTINHWPSFQERQHFITIGNFRHAPNWDSVLYLNQIWPQIRQQLPQAELHIYGSYAPKKATALHNPKNGFLVKGRADDVQQVLTQARICLAPLRFGAGIKGKLIDAMQAGTPSITTSIGVEGMMQNEKNNDEQNKLGQNKPNQNKDAQNKNVQNKETQTNSATQWPGLVANSPQTIIQHAVSLYQNEALWSAKQQQIEPLLTQRYDAQKLGPQLIDKIRLQQQNLSEHRLQNFTGAMLRHHSLQSTRYLSRWIELKNKV